MSRFAALGLSLGSLLGWFVVSACQPPGAALPPPASASGSHAPGAPGMHKDFSDASTFAQHFDDPARDAWQRPDEVIQHLNITPGSRVVDLGAGTGYFLSRLSAAVGSKGEVLALDVEPNMVRYIEARVRREELPNVVGRVVAADDPGLAPGSVARVLIVDTWHHIDGREGYARKLLRALEPGGEIWVVDFTLESELGPPPRHRVPPEQAVRELEAGGLHAEVFRDEQLPDQYMVRAWRD
jgi:SAM-dependent methyltransferase